MPLEYERADFVMCLFRNVIQPVDAAGAGSMIDRYKTSDAVWSFTRVSKRELGTLVNSKGTWKPRGSSDTRQAGQRRGFGKRKDKLATMFRVSCMAFWS